MDRNALDDLERHAVALDFLAQLRDAIELPRLPHRDVEERADDSTHRGYLADVREWNWIPVPEPAKGDQRDETAVCPVTAKRASSRPAAAAPPRRASRGRNRP